MNIIEDKTRGVIGPGTGLGVSVLFTSPFRRRKRVYVLPS
jgi:glucokinase